MEEDSKWFILSDKIVARIESLCLLLEEMRGEDVNRKSLVAKIAELRNVLNMMNEVEDEVEVEEWHRNME